MARPAKYSVEQLVWAEELRTTGMPWKRVASFVNIEVGTLTKAISQARRHGISTRLRA